MSGIRLRSVAWGAVAVASMLGAATQAAAVTRDEVVAWIGTPSPAVPPDAGRVLTQADMDTVRMLQPPAWAQEYDFPELELEIQASADWKPHPVYTAATEKFAGQSKLGPEGVLQNYTAGKPFSDEQIRAASAADAGLLARPASAQYAYGEAFELEEADEAPVQCTDDDEQQFLLDRNRDHRGLRILGQAQCFFGTFKAQLGQREAKRLVGCFEYLGSLRKGIG